ncbi:hypothetical protein HYU96_01095 [Candidatus Daviesbacteria bacterium]|nr:hypothetical protein [Candidatus Daviesbacteria bacterium]
METSPWLRLITIGLVLAALAVGYFLISGRFVSKEGVSQASPPATPTPSPTPLPTPQNAYSRILERSQTQVQTLPNTGSPLILISIFSLSAIISGLGLRKFPN